MNWFGDAVNFVKDHKGKIVEGVQIAGTVAAVLAEDN